MTGRAPRRRGLVAVLAFLVVAAAACARPPAPAWLPAAAWWAEDAARGIPRDPGELLRDDAGNRTRRLAEWADGDRVLGTRRIPEPLRSRAARWPAIAAAIAAGGLAARRDGLLAVTATGPGRADLRLLAEAENRDRRRGDAVMASLLDLDERELTRWAEHLRTARGDLDGAPAAVRAGSPPAP